MSMSNDFLKLSSKISLLYLMLMIWEIAFDKKFVPAFSNYFLGRNII